MPKKKFLLVDEEGNPKKIKEPKRKPFYPQESKGEYKKMLIGGLLKAPIKAAYKALRKSGGRNTSEIVKESKVSRDIAKSDVKSALRRDIKSQVNDPNLTKPKKRIIIQALNALKK